MPIRATPQVFQELATLQRRLAELEEEHGLRPAQAALPGVEAGVHEVVAEFVDGCVAVLSPSGVIRSAIGSEEVLGVRPEDLVGRSAWTLVLPEDLPEVAAFRSASERAAVEFRTRLPDGTVRWLELVTRPHLVGGEPREVVAVLREVSRRRLDEERVREAPPAGAARPPLADGFLAFDDSCRVASLSEGLLDVWGLPRDAIAPGASAEAVEAAELARVREPEPYRAALERERRSPDETTVLELELRDGRTLERTSAPGLRGGDGRTGRLVHYRDVTRRRQAEARMNARLRQQAAVASASRLALGAGALDDLLDAAAGLAAGALAVEVAAYLEALPQGGLVLRSGAGVPTGRGEPIPEEGTVAGLALRLRAPVRFSDLAADGRFRDVALEAAGAVSGLAVPVRGKERTIGVIAAWSRAARTFAVEDVHFLETLANVIAAAAGGLSAEAALRVRERLARAVFEGSLDGMLIADDDGSIVEANGAAAAALGLARESLVGRSLADGDLFRWGGESVERIPDPRQGRSEGEVAVRLPSGDRWLEWAAVGRILPGRHLLVLRDVTERRAMQTKLALADRMISVGALAAGVAHELNNPLAYLATNLAYLTERLPELAAPGAGRDEARAALEEAREGAERMRLIIADLRTFSRAPPERRGPVELGPVLQSCINMAWNEIRHRARLERDFDRAPAVFGNEARLAQVFVNVLLNAAQAIQEGAAERNFIRVSARASGDGLVAIEVRDTGQGIPPENLGRIFEPFFTTKPAGMGTGLGLSICKSIVESLGGRIDVESEPGVGTSVRVVLRAAQGEEQAARAPGAPPPLPRRRILVVDDEPLVGAALRRALGREHDVTLVPSARAGLELLRQGQRFDAVVCDILMPEMGGPEFHRELQVLDPPLARHTLFLTAGAFTTAARAFLELPEVAWLEKPFELDGLRRALGRVLTAE